MSQEKTLTGAGFSGFCVFLIETDPNTIQTIFDTISPLGIVVLTYLNVDIFFCSPAPLHKPGCILINVGLVEHTLPDFSERLKTHGMIWPVVLLVEETHFRFAIQVIKSQLAVDLITQPLEPQPLIHCVQEAFNQYHEALLQQLSRQELKAKLESLTPREKQILELVCLGLSNKQISEKVKISIKTAEIHRSKMLRKMKVKNSFDLARLIFDSVRTQKTELEILKSEEYDDIK